MEKISSINPASGKLIQSYNLMTAPAVDAVLARARMTFDGWRTWDFPRRGKCLKNVAIALRVQADRLARRAAAEMGKPIKQGLAEVEKCAWGCEYFAENAAALLKPEPITTEASKSYVAFQPMGVIFGIMPWNFPFWQIFRFAASTMMAGNTVVIKHAPNTTGCALAVGEIFKNAGLPEGAFGVLVIDHAQAAAVIKDPNIAAVSVTGSARAGRAVAGAAAEVLKKSVLEMGGSDPYVVLEDADLDEAAAAAVASRMANAGQVCIAAKRIIAVDAVRNELVRRVIAKLNAYVMGDPLDPKTTLGPLAREDLRAEVHRQVIASIQQGARLILGGVLPSGAGAYYPPTLLTEVKPGMPAFDEEVFGPVAAIVPAADEEEAVSLANRSQYGLGAVVFTRDTARGERIAAEKFEAGSCFVNSPVKSDPRLPFGGIKGSGYGRELGALGCREFTNAKTVWVK